MADSNNIPASSGTQTTAGAALQTTVGKAAVYIAPAPVPEKTPGKSVFLAGSIEQGKAEQWQPRITEDLSDITCTIFNPRRLNWDPTWEQRASNPQFREQVEWELNLLEKADVIAMYFDPETKSPITLLELGLHAAEKSRDDEQKKKLVVCCPEGYHRIGNVEIVCERAGIPVLGKFEELVEEVKRRLQKKA
ncbi:hypothetical protein V8D89_011646 [Ganoderma adspersum]